MYLGEVIVPQEDLAELVNAAEVLMVRGFAIPCEDLNESENNEQYPQDKDIFRYGNENYAGNIPENMENTMGKEGNSNYMYNPRVNTKRKRTELEEQARLNNKEKRYDAQQLYQDHDGGMSMTIKEEPLDQEGRLEFQGSTNGYMMGGKTVAPSSCAESGRSKPVSNMQMERGQEVNSGTSNADISNLLNVLIDSNPGDISVSDSFISFFNVESGSSLSDCSL